MGTQAVLSPEQLARLQLKIAAAEERTSGQIKVVIAASEWLGLKRKAKRLFEKLRLHETAQRNCVLILLVPKNREFLIYGDTGIHEVVGQHYWEDVREQMAAELREGRLHDGISVGIQLVGDKLAAIFPAGGETQDEISNAILFVA